MGESLHFKQSGMQHGSGFVLSLRIIASLRHWVVTRGDGGNGVVRPQVLTETPTWRPFLPSRSPFITCGTTHCVTSWMRGHSTQRCPESLSNTPVPIAIGLEAHGRTMETSAPTWPNSTRGFRTALERVRCDEVRSINTHRSGAGTMIEPEDRSLLG